MPRQKRSPSIYSLAESDDDDNASEGNYAESSESESKTRKTVKRKRVGTAGRSLSRVKRESGLATGDIEDIVGECINRSHGMEYHESCIEKNIGEMQEILLDWFEDVREKRGMPWRKKYDSTASMEEKGQRAYEIWGEIRHLYWSSGRQEVPITDERMTDIIVSEVMLQQTQVATVIAYWQRWIERWPTIADLAKADVEEVNGAWRGLGYYRRARSLLAGAKTVMSKSKYKGRLPDDPLVMEKEIDGVGRYTAGAICSMAYGVRTPIVDGNIHRLLTRLLAIHAPQTAPATIKFLWNTAERLVQALPSSPGREGVAGEWNQALMEHGSQICKPVSPECGKCPIQSGCNAYAELSRPPPKAISSSCSLCAPIPSTKGIERLPSVTIFPMKKEKKVSRAEEEAVCVVEWYGVDLERNWLLVKRPEKGLLAGLFEPPTTPLAANSSPDDRLSASISTLSNQLDTSSSTLESMIEFHREVGSIPHIFSHINMTYHIQHLVLNTSASSPPSLNSKPAVWLNEKAVETANVGTGVKKVWAEIYGSWGNFDIVSKSKPIGKKRVTKKRKNDQQLSLSENGKVVKKIMMPLMPVKNVKVKEDIILKVDDKIVVLE